MSYTKGEVIYLTSNGSLDLFPNNNACTFTNNITPHISLDNNKEYEMGLVSILFPKRFYAILKDNVNYEITFICKVGEIKDTYRYIPSNNILAGDVNLILESLNKDIYRKLEIYLENYDIHDIINNQKLFLWDGNNTLIQCTEGDNIEIEMIFSSDMAEILGFRKDTSYKFHGVNVREKAIYSSVPASPNKGLDYIYLYSDIIQPAYFGGQLVNILDCFVLENHFNKGLNNVIYRPLNTSIINGISIKISDQRGRPIHFEENSTITCILHIREKLI